MAEPPRFAQKTSVKIIGIGSNSKVFASSTVTAAKNKMTVMLSMNIASRAEIVPKQMSRGTVW